MPAALDFHGDGRVEGIPEPGLFGTCTACDGRIDRGIRRDGRIAMAHISGEVTIDAPVEEVFDLRSPLSVAREFERRIPGATLAVIPDCGHVSNPEAPGPFNELVRGFLHNHD